jgi:UDP-N-acetylmuramoylalanine--D-glutamate ligase
MGRSGQACQQALAGRTASLTLVDNNPKQAEVITAAELNLDQIDLLVVSPGWPPQVEPLPTAQQRGIPVISEGELAWQLRANPKAQWLAITGTDGKTTTTSMLTAILEAGGRQAIAAGNIGLPLVKAVADLTIDTFACEISSLQLHHCFSIAPAAACLLNLAPDHIDWHGSWQAYAAAKAKIFDRSGAVIVGPDANLDNLAATAGPASAQRIRLTLDQPSAGQIGIADGYLVDHASTTTAQPLVALSQLSHLASGVSTTPDAHYLIDALAAAALARTAGLPASAIAAGLSAFRLAEHRGQPVGQVNAVTYLDNSKATNPHAALAAFSALAEGKVVWIAGGLAKGLTYDTLITQIAKQLAGVVVIGQDQSKLLAALSRHASQVPVIAIAPSQTDAVMSHAVRAASQLAQAGDVVLLAPGAASMDQFASYAARGQAFAAAVADLPHSTDPAASAPASDKTSSTKPAPSRQRPDQAEVIQ